MKLDGRASLMKMENTPELTTERLLLRRFRPGDEEDLFAIYRDREVNRFLPWFPFETLSQAEEQLAKELAFYRNPAGYRYAICLKEEDRPIGYLKVDEGESHDFGYGLRKEYWNQGIVTEAGQALLLRLKEAGYRYITATHDRENPASGRVMQKLGMGYRYSYLEQWMPKDIPVTFRMYQLNFDGSDWTYLEYWNRYEPHFIETI